MREDALIKHLLRYDLEKIAVKLGLLESGSVEMSDTDAVKLLNIAEEYSRQDSLENQNKCLIICALLFEHRKKQWNNLGPFLVQLLSRLGLEPTMKMVDAGYDETTELFTSLDSFFSEVIVGMRLLEHEVKIGGQHVLVLSAFQKKVWNAIDQHSRLGISAATSAGKSFVLVNKIIDIMLKKKGEVVYVVPTISLINQVSTDLKKIINKYNLGNFNILQGYADKYATSDQHTIYVLTQERALSALSHEDAFKNLSLLIIDEVQNIEKVSGEDDERSSDMFAVINEFENSIDPERIIISGPRIKNVDTLVKQLFGGKGHHISDEAEHVPPVINLTYSFHRDSKKIYFHQYSTIDKEPQKLLLDGKQDLFDGIFKKKRYTPKVYDVISGFLSRLDDNSGTIVFSPTKREAVKTSLALSERIALEETAPEIKSLIEYLKETVHPNYSMILTVSKGVGYHHAGVPHHVRLSIEKAFSKKIIKTLVCTTTLMQGVNLPAKNIIARNPDLFIQNRDGVERLTPYEFANLRGRAGRLMKDFIGRAIILDEPSFADSSIDIAEYPEKEVKAGFEERFNANKKDIVNSLVNGEKIIEEKSYNDLTIYIRRIVLKYGEAAKKRLKLVGIEISDAEIHKVEDQLKNLSIPKDICTRNHHWDPLVLDYLWHEIKANNWTKLPSTPMEGNFVNDFISVIEKMQSEVPYYFNKYLKGYDAKSKRTKSMLIAAKKWALGSKLKEIIDWADPTNDDINARIENINTKIMHSIPKLLRPLIDIQNAQNPILTYLEMGAWKPETRRMIELGIARETAVSINRETVDLSLLEDNKVSDNLLVGAIKKIYKKLNYWEQLQLDDFL